MSYSLTILWHERQRYLAAVLAVAFSALLISLQCGLVVGMLSFATLPIDHTHADIWVGGPALASIDLGTPIPERFVTRVAANPEVERCEVYLQAFSSWSRRDGTTELCMVTGSRLGSLILAESFWVGVIGIMVALPLAFVLGEGAQVLGVRVMLPVWLLMSTVAITLMMALVSSVAALRLVQVLEPVALLR